MARNVSARIVDVRIVEPKTNVIYPRVEGLPDQAAQDKINQAITDLVAELRANPQPGYEPGKTDITITYKVGVNRNGVLSLRFEVYSFVEMAAHGFTLVRSLTFNLDNGEIYVFADLFKPGSNYQELINAFIKKQFAAEDIPVINEFESISDDQEYYLTVNDLVVYFQLYEYTPYYVGIPEFSIPYSSLSEVINPAGPIARIYTPPVSDGRPGMRINLRYGTRLLH